MTAETSSARGEWVLVPRELTQGMRSALARAVNASCNTDEWYAHTLAAAPQPPSAPVGVEWDMPCGECSCGVYDARAFAAFDGTFPKCRRFDRYCVGAIHCAQALAQQPAAEERGAYYVCPVCHGPGRVTRETHDRYQQPAAVDEAMVERAAAAVMSAPPGISVEAYVRIVLEAALATQHQEPKS